MALSADLEAPLRRLALEPLRLTNGAVENESKAIKACRPLSHQSESRIRNGINKKSDPDQSEKSDPDPQCDADPQKQ